MPAGTKKKRSPKTRATKKRAAAGSERATSPTRAKPAKKERPKKRRKPAKKKRPRPTKTKSPTPGKKKRPTPATKKSPKPAHARAASRAGAAPAEASAAARLIEEAMAEASDGNLERAAELMLAAADADPTDWRLPNEAGVFYFQVARYEDALRCYDRTLTIVPDDVPVLMNRALAFVLMGDDAGARAALQKVFAVDPIHAPAFFELGKLHQKAGEHEDALQCFDTALAHETMSTLWNAAGAPPRNMRLVFLVMLNKARAYFALDRADDGASQAQSLWNEFRDPDALLKLARELAAQARDADAGRVADIVLADHPDHAEARRFRAEL